MHSWSTDWFDDQGTSLGRQRHLLLIEAEHRATACLAAIPTSHVHLYRHRGSSFGGTEVTVLATTFTVTQPPPYHIEWPSPSHRDAAPR